jgi:uncharacterized RDD family membrane protein YckC
MVNTSFRRTLTIETPEGAHFGLPLCGPIARFLAWCIDTLVITFGCSVLARVLYVLGTISRDAMTALSVLGFFMIWMGYGMTLEWIWQGQTIGKRVMGLRVMDADGLRLQPSQIVIRNLMRSLDSLPGLYLVGGMVLLLSRHYQRLGDLVSNTVVVRARVLEAPKFTVLEGEKYNSLLDSPHLAARLRANTSPELAQLAYQALLRRNEFEPGVRVKLFAAISNEFRRLAQYPDELTSAMTDERYIRNALQVLTDKGGRGKRRMSVGGSANYN